MARDVVREAPECHDVIGRTARDLDVSDADALARTICDVQPDAIINAAAYTDVDGAEREAERAFAVNGAALGFIGAAAQAADTTSGSETSTSCEVRPMMSGPLGASRTRSRANIPPAPNNRIFKTWMRDTSRTPRGTLRI